MTEKDERLQPTSNTERPAAALFLLFIPKAIFSVHLLRLFAGSRLENRE